MFDKLIDTHCDTAYELYCRHENLKSNTCHINIDRASTYKRYAQFFAIWSDKNKSNQLSYEDFFKISHNFKKEIAIAKDQIDFCTSFNQMASAWDKDKIAAFLAVEDARLLDNDISRLDVLYDEGVRYLTLMWGGHTCIGASHDVNGGLTDFGRAVVNRCFDLGIIPDVSHSNAQTTSDIIEIAYMRNKPIIASHSNCYSLYPHTRNLRDEHLKSIIELGGIVGISLCPYHLTDTNKECCNVTHIADHIERYLELGAENILGFGCDLDGTSLPYGFFGVNDIISIANELKKRGISDSMIEKITYKNYYDFIKRNLL